MRQRDEELTFTGGAGGGDFDGEVREAGNTHRIEELRLDVGERFEGRRVWLSRDARVFVVVGY